MEDTIIRELGGGAISILVVLMLSGYGVLGLVIRALWIRINVLQDKLSDVQGGCSEKIANLQISTNTTLGAVQTTMASLVALLQDRRGGH